MVNDFQAGKAIALVMRIADLLRHAPGGAATAQWCTAFASELRALPEHRVIPAMKEQRLEFFGTQGSIRDLVLGVEGEHGFTTSPKQAELDSLLDELWGLAFSDG